MSQTFTVENFKGVREITLSPEGSLVVIAGGNGAGKSSFIDAFVELFDPKGTRLTPKPIRDGEDEARAQFVDTDLDIRVVRTWKKNDAGRLEVFALDGAKYGKPAEVVAKLTGGLIFDPVAFLNLDEKKQRDALLAKVHLPFDIDEVAREKAGAEGRRLEAGRDVKRLEGALASIPKPAPGTPAKEVSSQDILDEIEAARSFEADGAMLRANVAAADAETKARADRVAELEAQLERERGRLSAAKADRADIVAELKQWEETPERPDAEKLRAQLAAVEETNAAVRTARDHARVAAELKQARAAHEAAQADIDAVEARKADGLAAASFPVEGLSVDESGVTFEGIPFAQVNSAMRRRIAFAIATAGDPQLRLVIVKDGDLLDAESIEAIRDLAARRGYTALIERDRDESRQIGFTIVDGALGGAQ
ncbi:AAA family ATPase [uncultured Microbacterium sp.]|uniref:ATP-binding protein n=1 Tax=uncultured Microbacterium sp. TaxID=191216 RepID=UPI0025D72F89|nr:AAA family ATPase [uncultured Microbacterium sp.]